MDEAERRQYIVRLKDGMENEAKYVVQWFKSMRQEAIPAVIYTDINGEKWVNVVGLEGSDSDQLKKCDELCILGVMFERLKMWDGGEGGFCNSNKLLLFEDDFVPFFVVERAKLIH